MELQRQLLAQEEDLGISSGIDDAVERHVVRRVYTVLNRFCRIHVHLVCPMQKRLSQTERVVVEVMCVSLCIAVRVE